MTDTATADAHFVAEFSLPAGRLFGFLLLRHCFWLLTAVVMAGLALLCIGFAIDLRVAIAGLMIWCFCLPMIVAFCWFRYALIPLNAFNLLPHTLRFTSDSMEVCVKTKRFNSKEDVAEWGKEWKEEDMEEKKISKDRIESEEAEDENEVKTFFYPMAAITGREAYGGGVFLCIKEKPDAMPGYLFVPASEYRNLESILGWFSKLA